MTNTIYDTVTQSIIEQLEKGAIPWVKPWNTDSSADINFITKKPYQGVNRLILGMRSMSSGFNSPVWATFKQYSDKGIQVKKGEKGTAICYYEPKTKIKTNDNGEELTENYAILKTYWVFNSLQTDLPIVKSDKKTDRKFNPIPACESFIKSTGAIITHGGDSAFYMPSEDKINLPNMNSFNELSGYYATAFHELIHWSGAKHRLDRQLDKGKFGNPAYAFEELVAELGASFLCQDYKIQGDLRHAGYIQSWLKALKDDNKAIFKASALAQKGADYLNAMNIEKVKVA